MASNTASVEVIATLCRTRSAIVSRTGALFRSSLTNVERVISLRGTIVRPLAGIELRIDNQSVLQIVDADGGSFAKPNGAKMSRNFEPALVRFLDSARPVLRG